MEQLEESLREFRSQLPLVAAGGEIGSDATVRLSEHRTRIQAELRRVMSANGAARQGRRRRPHAPRLGNDRGHKRA